MNASCWNFAFCLVLAAGLVFAAPVRAEEPEVTSSRRTTWSLPPEGLVIPETPDFPYRIDVAHETDTHIMAVISGHFGDLSTIPHLLEWPLLHRAAFRVFDTGIPVHKLPGFLFRNMDAVKRESAYFLSVTIFGKSKTHDDVPEYILEALTLSPHIPCDLKVCQFWPPAFRAVTHHDMVTLLREAPPERKRRLSGVPFLFKTDIILTKLRSKKNKDPAILAAPHSPQERNRDNVIPVTLSSMTNIQGPLVEDPWEDYPAWLIVWLEEGPEGEFSFTGSIVRLYDGLPDLHSFQEE